MPSPIRLSSSSEPRMPRSSATGFATGGFAALAATCGAEAAGSAAATTASTGTGSLASAAAATGGAATTTGAGTTTGNATDAGATACSGRAASTGLEAITLGDAAAAAVAPDNFFKSSRFFDSSATRMLSAFFSRSFEIFSSAAAPLLRVSLSGAAAATCCRSVTVAWTLPLANRVLPSALASGRPAAKRCR